LVGTGDTVLVSWAHCVNGVLIGAHRQAPSAGKAAGPTLSDRITGNDRLLTPLSPVVGLPLAKATDVTMAPLRMSAIAILSFVVFMITLL
jgi:hypothetical protein